MKTKLSIIVPVYNVEKYLEICIESLLYQNLKNAEILLIDDGSTDNSGKICDSFSQKYDIVKTIHQKNKGLSGARNTGIKMAKGEYLMFVDSDDFISNDAKIENIINDIEEEIIQYNFVYYFDASQKKYYNKNSFNLIIDSNIFKNLLIVQEKNNFSCCVCDKFFKRDFIISNNLLFTEGIVCEDMEWMLKVYSKVKSIKYIDKNIYMYRQQRKGSITNIVKSQNIDCLFSIIKTWYDYDFKNEDQKSLYLSFLAYHYLILITEINKNNCSKTLKKEIYEYKNILEYDCNNKVKMCNKLIKVVGLKISILIFRLYIKLKNKGFIRL